jgi:hypothetical protein
VYSALPLMVSLFLSESEFVRAKSLALCSYLLYHKVFSAFPSTTFGTDRLAFVVGALLQSLSFFFSF